MRLLGSVQACCNNGLCMLCKLVSLVIKSFSLNVFAQTHRDTCTHTHTHTHRIDCSTWTTKVVGKQKITKCWNETVRVSLILFGSVRCKEILRVSTVCRKTGKDSVVDWLGIPLSTERLLWARRRVKCHADWIQRQDWYWWARWFSLHCPLR